MITLVATCLSWYISSAITNTISKEILNIIQFPLFLTLIQFGLTALFSGIYLKMFCKSYKLWNSSDFKMTFPITLFQISASILSSLALQYTTVSFCHTIKALSPLFTVLTYRLLYSVIPASRVYYSLMILTFGVMLVVATDLKFHLAGFIFLLVSTLIFVLQNIYSKRLFSRDLKNHNGEDFKQFNLMFHTSIVSFILTVPIWYFMEYSSIGDFSLNYHLCNLFILNGFSQFSQAALSLSVLSLVSPISYSIASLCKRIFVISASIMYFQDHINIIQLFGLFTTFLGLYLYHLSEVSIVNVERLIAKKQKSKGLLT